jgi:hypothetical protein
VSCYISVSADSTVQAATLAESALVAVIAAPKPNSIGSDLWRFEGLVLGGTAEAYEWRSDCDGLLSETQSLSLDVRKLTPGTHRISFRARGTEWSPWAETEVVVETPAPTNQYRVLLPIVIR